MAASKALNLHLRPADGLREPGAGEGRSALEGPQNGLVPSTVVLSFACAALAAGPQQNIMTGTGQSAFAKVHINAKSDADTSTDARGRFRLEQGIIDIEGRVTCLRVVENLSVAGGVIERSHNPFVPVGRGFLQFTEDNGSPGTLDRWHTVLSPVPPPTCPDPTPAVNQVVNGNFVVKQAAGN